MLTMQLRSAHHGAKRSRARNVRHRWLVTVGLIVGFSAPAPPAAICAERSPSSPPYDHRTTDATAPSAASFLCGVTAKDVAEFPPEFSSGSEPTAVIIARFQGQWMVPMAERKVRKVMRQVNDWYEEVSHGQTRFDYDLYSGVTVPFPFSCKFDADDAVIEAADPLIDYTQYDRLMLFFPGPFIGVECAFGGYSSVGKRTIRTEDGTIRASVSVMNTAGLPFSPIATRSTIHEFGHALGLYHANGWDCGDDPLEGPCRSIEYGNAFDIMGEPGGLVPPALALPHFSPGFKVQLGWLPEDAVLDVEPPGGRYMLAPLEPPAHEVDPPQALRIARGEEGEAFYVEFRQPIGVDQRIRSPKRTYSGVLINLISSGAKPSQLINARPERGHFGKAAWIIGQSLEDSRWGIRITPIALHDQGIEVEVEFGP